MDSNVHMPIDPFGYIRTLHVNDVSQAYVDALNDRDITIFMMARGRTVASDVVKYIEDNLADPCALLLGIFDQNDCLIGTSRVHDISHEASSCWMGVFLFHKEIMGKGLGSSVVRIVSDYVMKVLHISRVQAGILTINESSRACFRKAGFSLAEDGLDYHGLSREIWERRKANV